MSAVKWPDMVRFTNTGTEAVQHSLHLARHATSRTRIVKVEGSYHGLPMTMRCCTKLRQLSRRASPLLRSTEP